MQLATRPRPSSTSALPRGLGVGQLWSGTVHLPAEWIWSKQAGPSNLISPALDRPAMFSRGSMGACGLHIVYSDPRNFLSTLYETSTTMLSWAPTNTLTLAINIIIMHVRPHASEGDIRPRDATRHDTARGTPSKLNSRLQITLSSHGPAR